MVLGEEKSFHNSYLCFSLYTSLIGAVCLSQLKNFEAQCVALEKENARLRETHENLHKNFTKVCDAIESMNWESAKLKKAHEQDLQVISNHPNFFASKINARKDAKDKGFLFGG